MANFSTGMSGGVLSETMRQERKGELDTAKSEQPARAL